MAKKTKKPAEADGKEGRDIGRPTTYDDAFPEQAKRLALLGLTDKEMAEFFGCAESTFYLWQKEHPDFSEALRAGKVIADANVAAKLYDRAMGAEWIEDVPFKVKTVTYEGGKKVREDEDVQVVAVRRAAPPDTPALALWLHNRQPKRWRQKPEPNDDDETALPVKVVVQVRDARRATDAQRPAG